MCNNFLLRKLILGALLGSSILFTLMFIGPRMPYAGSSAYKAASEANIQTLMILALAFRSENGVWPSDISKLRSSKIDNKIFLAPDGPHNLHAQRCNNLFLEKANQESDYTIKEVESYGFIIAERAALWSDDSIAFGYFDTRKINVIRVSKKIFLKMIDHSK